MKKILFLSWQGAMGHITRDLAIVKELRRQNPEIEISWLAHPLASKLIKQAGETLLPESELSADYSQAAIPCIGNFTLNIMKYAMITQKPREHNVNLFKQVIATYHFDLVIGDESYEILRAMIENKIHMKSRTVTIEDFVGFDAMTKNPLEKLGVYQRNRLFSVDRLRIPSTSLINLFIGEPEDVPDKSFGFLLPNRREFAKKHYHFLGYVIRFDPAEYKDNAKIRAKLGYGSEPLLICATGGTGAGKELIELCGKAFPILRKHIKDLRMVCVCGELFGLTPPKVPPDVEVHTFIPDIYEHYAASDMAVIVGGGTTTAELTALRRPFIFFPLENQFDQQINIAERLARHGAGIKMRYFKTTPESLAQTILANIGKEVSWRPVVFDGAHKAAELITRILDEKGDRLLF